jgi:hypothetical protein
LVVEALEGRALMSGGTQTVTYDVGAARAVAGLASSPTPAIIAILIGRRVSGVSSHTVGGLVDNFGGRKK